MIQNVVKTRSGEVRTSLSKVPLGFRVSFVYLTVALEDSETVDF